MADPVPMCGYGCRAPATEDFLWPSDAEVWHVCARHADALQRMLDAQSDGWAARVVRSPSGSPGGVREPADPADDPQCAGWLGARLRSVLGTMRDWLRQR